MAREIAIRVTGDTRDLERALSRAGGRTQTAMQKVSRAAKVAGLAIGAGLAIAAKVGFDELAEGQKVAAQTAAVLKSTGGQANVTAQEVEALAQQLSDLSGVDDELIQSSENLLLTFTRIRNEAGKGNDIFNQATEAALDMSVAMGTDLQTATLQVGKALNDPIRGMSALRRVGVQLTEKQEALIKKLVETGDVAGAQKVILEELNTEFGGSAKAAGETLPGQLNKAKNSFEELAASLVELLLPAITDIVEKFVKFIEFMREHPDLSKGVVIALGILTGALLTAAAAQTLLNLAVLANPYVAAAAAIVAIGIGIAILIKKVQFFRDHWQLLLLGLGVGVVVAVTVVKAIIRNFDKIKPVLQAIRTVAVTAFNIIRAVATTVFNTIRSVITARINSAKAAVSAAIAVMKTVFNGLVGPVRAAIDKVADAFRRLPGVVRGVASAVAAGLSPIVSVLSSAWGWIRSVIGALDSLASRIRSLPSLPDLTPGFNLPGFQHGGVVPGPRGAPQLAVVHGGETVLPTHRRGGGMMGTVVVPVYLDGRMIAEATFDPMRNKAAQFKRTNGKAAF